MERRSTKAVTTGKRAIRAITACSCIYRIAKGGTEGIDSIYKDLFAGKEKVDGMCWLDSDSNSKSSDTLLESLKTCLKSFGKIDRYFICALCKRDKGWKREKKIKLKRLRRLDKNSCNWYN